MRTHTNEFKQEINKFGRQIKGKVIYYNSYGIIAENNDNILTENDLYLISEQPNYQDPIEISEENIFQIDIIKNGNLLQSLMKQCNFESKIDINIGSVINPHLGVLVGNSYEYLDYGNYIIHSKEYNIDNNTWSYICYDKMLFSMVKYKGIDNITLPITIKQYINILCNKIGLEFEDTTFVNQSQLIYEDVYKDKGMTVRDVFDEISKIVGGNLLINDSGKLEIGYINNLVGDLPAEYVQVDYIECNGTQYIDTGIYGNLNTEIDVKLTNNSVSTNLLGDITTSTQAISCNFGVNNVGSRFGNKVTNAALNTIITYNTPFILKENKNGVYINDTQQIVFNTETDFTTTNTLLLLNRNSSSGPNATGWKGKLYYCQIYNDNTLVRDFIPCYKKSNGEVGLYDLISQMFFTNQGEGSFTKGNKTAETIDDNCLKDINVKMNEKVGVINSVAIYDDEGNYQYLAEDTTSIKQNGLTRVTITNNLLALNGDTQTIANNILAKLNGLYYYVNDFTTTGVCYYDFLDLFNVEARGETYQCLLLNNEITITQGIEEHIFTEELEEIQTSTSDYTTSIMTNKQVQFRINQQEAQIESKVSEGEVVSVINQSPEKIYLKSNRLEIESDNFTLTEDGTIKSIAGEIGGFVIGEYQLYGLHKKIDNPYTQQDLTNIRNYISGTGTLDEYQLEFYDYNKDGVVNSVDYVLISKLIENSQKEYTVELNSRYIDKMLNIYDENNEMVVKLGSDGGQFSTITTNQGFSLNDGENVSISTANRQDSHTIVINLDTTSTLSQVQIQGVNGNETGLIILNAKNGNVYCGSVTQYSTVEKKKNFEKLTNAKEILNATDIYKYNFKDEDDNVKKSIGFVIGDDFNYSQEITSENNDGANIYSMVSVLWQVVKEQQEEIDKLKEVINNGKY